MTYWFMCWVLFTTLKICVIKVAASTELQGRTIAQAVIPRLPSSVVRVGSQIKFCGICGEQSGAGTLFLLAFWFTCPILILSTLHLH
jgi:hypothetical protein